MRMPPENRIVKDTFIDVNAMIGMTILGEGAVRGAGHTTHQIKTAPKNSWFVWCTDDKEYAEYLCQCLGRDDLWVERASWIRKGLWEREFYRPRANLKVIKDLNRNETMIVIDHAFDALQNDQYRKAEYDYRKRNFYGLVPENYPTLPR